MTNMVFVLVLVLGLIVRGRTRARKRALGMEVWSGQKCRDQFGMKQLMKIPVK